MELRKIMDMKKNPCNCADDMSGAKLYHKFAVVRAKQMNRDFAVKTPHGLVQAQAGDYLCENTEGTDRWPVKKEIFERTYEVFPCQDPIDETKRSTTKFS